METKRGADKKRKDKTKAYLTFRAVLLITLLAIPLLAVAVVGFVSYRNARFIVKDLSTRLLQGTSGRIHDQIKTLVDRAGIFGRVTAKRLSGRPLSAKDLPEVAESFQRVMELHPELTYLSLGLETGDYCHIRRTDEGRLEIAVMTHLGEGKARRTDYDLTSSGQRVLKKTSVESYDPRKRPFYVAAKRKKAQTWLDVYIFKNGQTRDYPGLTCATPVMDGQGELTGVVTVDFDLRALGRFLEGLEVLEGGVAFVVEMGRSGKLRVIAHPNPDLIVGSRRGREGSSADGGGTDREEILPIDELKSPELRAFVKKVKRRVFSKARGTKREGARGRKAGTRASTDFGRITFQSDGTAYAGTYEKLKSRHDLSWFIATLVPRAVLMERVRKNNRQTYTIAVVSLILAVVAAVVLAALISRPLKQLARETEAIGRFELDPNPQSFSSLVELERLASSMEEMKAGLRSFSKYVPAELVRAVLASGSEAVLGGRREELTIYFSDIAGFTSIAEGLAPEELVELLGEYLGAMSAGVAQEKGTVDKYIGDAVMAFWGAPKSLEDHAVRACTAALRNTQALERLNHRWKEKGRPSLPTRIGIHTGEVIVGNMGCSERLNYTVVGDAVNLASRLEGLNKFYKTKILISETTYLKTKESVVARPLERVSVKGRERGILVYELLSLREQADESLLELSALSEKAVEAYYDQRFKEAQKHLELILEIRQGDVAATRLWEKAQKYADEQPPEGWDGVRRMESK